MKCERRSTALNWPLSHHHFEAAQQWYHHFGFYFLMYKNVEKTDSGDDFVKASFERGENEAKDESVGILMVLLDFFSSTYFPLALFEIVVETLSCLQHNMVHLVTYLYVLRSMCLLCKDYRSFLVLSKSICTKSVIKGMFSKNIIHFKKPVKKYFKSFWYLVSSEWIMLC